MRWLTVGCKPNVWSSSEMPPAFRNISPETLLLSLRALECELQEPKARSDRERLSALIHSDFREFGRSGVTYTKADVLEQLPGEKQPAKIHAQHFQIQALAEGVMLLTYKSANISVGGSLDHHALRASVWKLEPSGWQLIFHQGTPTSAFAQNEGIT
jgi:hypothetical protein